MVNFGPLAAVIGPVVWGTPANFNGFRVLAALLHGTPVVGVMAALPNIGGALCPTPQSLADDHYYMPCSNAAKTRKQLKFGRVPQTTGSISAASGPKFTILWGLGTCGGDVPA